MAATTSSAKQGKVESPSVSKELGGKTDAFSYNSLTAFLKLSTLSKTRRCSN